MIDRAPFQPVPFRSAWWLPGPHLQTLGARMLRARLKPRYSRRRLETPDGDFVDLDVGPGDSSMPGVLIIHGLEGCSHSGYVLRAVETLLDRGIRAYALNFRSRSGEPNRKPGSYHAGHTQDIAFVLESLVAELPAARLGVLGFSLGGNAVLKFLGEIGPEARRLLRAAAVISAPLDLFASAASIERGLGPFYARHFLRTLKETVRTKAELFPGIYDLQAVASARSIREFDNAFTAPVHGFRDVDHYYEACSSGRYVASIRVPTLILGSRDDPLAPVPSMDGDRLERNPCLVSLMTDRGGHVGFIAGRWPGSARFWAEEETVRFLHTHLSEPAG